MSQPNVDRLDVTRPWRDGGRDAVGDYLLGPRADPVAVEFALEAKCYGPGNSVGVRETSRLISRLRHREFGVLVTRCTGQMIWQVDPQPSPQEDRSAAKSPEPPG